jgi:Cu/Ag efflux protein CusF
MKILLTTFTLAAMFVGSALAGEIAGKVQSVDMDAKRITLEDGSEFTVDKAASLDGIEAGTSVKITYDDSSNIAVAITAM